MADADRDLERDLDKLLETAGYLRTKDSSAETQTFVSQQIAQIHTFLGKKQSQTETQLKEEIEKEQKELDSLRERIRNVELNGDGGGDTDGDHRDVSSLWYSLKDVEWQAAFDALLDHTQIKVKDILSELLLILTTSFQKCQERKAKNLDDIMFQALFPGGNKQDKDLKLPKTRDEDLSQLCSYSQEKTIQFCLPTLTRSIAQDVRQDKNMAEVFNVQSKHVKAAYDKYLDKCVEFSWIAGFEKSQICLVTDPKHKCDKALRLQFQGLDDVPKKSYVEWPAVVQQGYVRIPWLLYHHKGQPRPTTKVTKTRPGETAVVEQPKHDKNDTLEGENVYNYHQKEPAAEQRYEYNQTKSKANVNPPMVLPNNAEAHGQSDRGTKNKQGHGKSAPILPANQIAKNRQKSNQPRDPDVEKKKENLNSF